MHPRSSFQHRDQGQGRQAELSLYPPRSDDPQANGVRPSSRPFLRSPDPRSRSAVWAAKLTNGGHLTYGGDDTLTSVKHR
jgi:hypothetical protein